MLESNFNLNYIQVKKLTTDVVNEILNCKEYTTIRSTRNDNSSVENEILNCKEYLTLYKI